MDSLEEIYFFFDAAQDALVLSSLIRMVEMSLKSLKRLELSHYSINQNEHERQTLQVSPFLSQFKTTLQSVHLEGMLDNECYNLLFNQMPNLRNLILVARLNENQLTALDSLEMNATIKTFFLKFEDTSQLSLTSNFIRKMSNLEVLFMSQKGMMTEDWKVVMNNMKKLHTVHFMAPISKKNVFRNNIFPAVKTLCMVKACSTESHWNTIAKSFPNVETLIISNVVNRNTKHDFDLEMIPRSWGNSLKRLELDEGVMSSISSFIVLLENFPELKTVVVSPNVFLWKMTTLKSDRAALTRFMQNGLRLFTLREFGKVASTYKGPSIKKILEEKTPSLSSGFEIEIDML